MFDEIRLPEEITYNSTRGPEYVTSVYENETHVEHRVLRTPVGRLRYVIHKDLLTIDMIKALEVFMRGRKGRTYGFRYKDWEEYQLTDEPLDNNGTVTLQLIKTYNDAIRPEVRKIVKPVAGTVTLKKNGVEFASAGNWSIDNTTGIITLNTTWVGSTFTWSGQFDTPVRFASDRMSWTREALNIHNWSSIELVELIY